MPFFFPFSILLFSPSAHPSPRLSVTPNKQNGEKKQRRMLLLKKWRLRTKSILATDKKKTPDRKKKQHKMHIFSLLLVKVFIFFFCQTEMDIRRVPSAPNKPKAGLEVVRLRLTFLAAPLRLWGRNNIDQLIHLPCDRLKLRQYLRGKKCEGIKECMWQVFFFLLYIYRLFSWFVYIFIIGFIIITIIIIIYFYFYFLFIYLVCCYINLFYFSEGCA